MVRIAASGATLNPVAAASPFGVKLLDREGRHHNQRSCSDLESDPRGDWRARCQGIENAQRRELKTLNVTKEQWRESYQRAGMD